MKRHTKDTDRLMFSFPHRSVIEISSLSIAVKWLLARPISLYG